MYFIQFFEALLNLDTIFEKRYILHYDNTNETIYNISHWEELVHLLKKFIKIWWLSASAVFIKEISTFLSFNH